MEEINNETITRAENDQRDVPLAVGGASGGDPTNKMKEVANPKKVVLFGFALLAVLLVAGVIFYYYQLQRSEKGEAARYLLEKNEEFEQVVVSVNELSTEKIIPDIGDSDLYLRRASEEVSKSAAALGKVRSAKTNFSSEVGNEYISDVDGKLRDFYPRLEEVLSEYDVYIKYLESVSKVIVRLDDWMRDNSFDGSTNKELAGRLEAAVDMLTEAKESVSSAYAPDELYPQKKKILESLDADLNFVKDAAQALRTNNSQKIKQLESEENIDKFENFEKEINQMEKDYFASLRSKFTDLTNEAKNLENALLIRGRELRIDVESVAIQEW